MRKIHLNHKHAHTLQQIFQHPTSHNLEWREVVALIKEVGTVQEEDNRRLNFTVNGITEVFHPTQDKKDVTEVDQVMRLRHLMERAGITMDGTVILSQQSQEDQKGLESQEGIPEHDVHAHDPGRVNAEQNRHSEQQLKTQEREQNERSNFLAGNAQTHQQGNRQK